MGKISLRVYEMDDETAKKYDHNTSLDLLENITCSSTSPK